MVSVFDTLDNSIIILILCCVVFLLFILTVILALRLNKLTNRINVFAGTRTSKSTASIENTLSAYYQKVMDVENKVEYFEKNLTNLNKELSTALRKCGFVRFTSFENVGGNLSFALALLDNGNNGYVLNSIFTSDGGYFYCKPVTNGGSDINLSPEEEQAIKMAVESF